jgi:type II secretory pathway component PulF
MFELIDKKLTQLLFTKSEQQAFLEDVGNLVKDGVPAPRAIATLQDIGSGPSKKVAKNILDKVSAGQRISDGMEGWFPPSIVEIIRAGEAGGALAETMASAAASLAQRSSAFSSVLSSVLYPLVVFFMGLGVSVFLKHSVFENFAAIRPIDNWPQDGKMLLTIASFVESWWWLAIVIIATIALTVRSILLNVTGNAREIIDTIPPFSLYKDYIAALFMETLGLLLANRIGFKQALNILQANATHYLAWHIYLMQFRLSGGRENIADVLDSGMINNSDLQRLRVMAKGKGFDQALMHLGAQSLARNSRNVIRTGKIAGALLLAIDAMFIVFMIFAVYGVGSYIGSS